MSWRVVGGRVPEVISCDTGCGTGRITDVSLIGGAGCGLTELGASGAGFWSCPPGEPKMQIWLSWQEAVVSAVIQWEALLRQEWSSASPVLEAGAWLMLKLAVLVTAGTRVEVGEPGLPGEAVGSPGMNLNRQMVQVKGHVYCLV